MKNKLTIILFVLAVSLSSFGQTILTNTTLSAAVSTTRQNVIVVASASGISAPSPNTGNTAGLATSNAQSFLYVIGN